MNDISSHLTAILGRLCAAVGAFMAAQARGPQMVWLGSQAFAPTTRANDATTLPLETWHHLTLRLGRLAQRFRTLFARWQSNTLPALRPSRAGLPRHQSAVARPAQPRLPAARAWINARIPEAAAPCAGTLEHLLHNTELMRDFVQQVPRAGRLLRPLCRMLGVTPPDYLRLPPRPHFSPLALGRGGWAAKRTDEGGSGVTNPPKQEAPKDRPLPKYVLAAARAWRSKSR